MSARDFLAALESQFPPWLIAAAMSMAAAGFLASFVQQQRGEPLRLSPPLAVAVAAALSGLGIIYIWLALDSSLPQSVRAGAIRPSLFALGVALTLYNGGNVMAVLRATRRAFRMRFRHG